MNEQKSIYACYEEIKQREIRELKQALEMHNGKFVFDPDVNAPEVLCNMKYVGPADVRITSVSLDDDGNLIVTGQQHGESGCADWYESECEINLSDIAYGHIDFITKSIPSRTFSKESFCISSLSREDLDALGFDTSDVDDATMERIASKLGDDYCENLLWTSLEIIAEEGFDIPRKEGRDNED